MIGTHEAGHGAILPRDLDDDRTCCAAELMPTNVNWHSIYANDVMFGADPGEAFGPTAREVGWLAISYPRVD